MSLKRHLDKIPPAIRAMNKRIIRLQSVAAKVADLPALTKDLDGVFYEYGDWCAEERTREIVTWLESWAVSWDKIDDVRSQKIKQTIDAIRAKYPDAFTKEDASCKKCGTPLDAAGRCEDETCPYSDRAQTTIYTED